MTILGGKRRLGNKTEKSVDIKSYLQQKKNIVSLFDGKLFTIAQKLSLDYLVISLLPTLKKI